MENVNMIGKRKYTFCEAIARQEGWFSKVPALVVCQRNNNPGNIRYGTFAKEHGATADAAGFAVFPTAQDGFNAMSELLEAVYLGLTVKQAIYKWAPPIENNSDNYVNDVCAWTGLSPDTILTKELIAPPIVTPVQYELF